MQSAPTIISFVIPAFNEASLIEQCLQSIQALERPAGISEFEVIVVDNQSTDETAEISRRNGARVIACPPGKPSRARNLGATQATGNWLAFVDADCQLPSDWLNQIAPLFEARDIVAVGCDALPPRNTPSWVTRTLGDLAETLNSNAVREVRWLPTAGLIVKKADFDAIGGFNESLVTCEDCDLGYRLTERGRLLHTAATSLTHHGESTTLQEVFRREAWRSSDNLRLALGRPADFKNWLSLVVPAVFLLLLVLGTIGLGWAVWSGHSFWPWMAVLLAGLCMPLAFARVRAKGKLGWASLIRRSVVVAAFFLGRAVGLAWRFPRVAR